MQQRVQGRDCPLTFAFAANRLLQEGDTRIIELDSDNPVIVEMMIQFFYSLNYNDGASTKQKINNQVTNAIQSNGDEQGLTNSSPLLNNALVYAMADKYQVKWLKDRAISKTWHRLSENFKLKEFSDAIDTVWTSTPSSDNRMRSLYLENFLIRRCEILSGSDADTSLIWANNDFLRDVIRAEAEVLQGDNQSTLGIRMSLKCTIHNSEEEPTCRHYHDNGRSRVELKFKLNYNEPKTSMFKEP